MDIGQLVFPFIMAVITNSLMIIIIYFLRKVPYFSNLFSVWFMVILYLFCVLRIFLPIEFPDAQIVLMDHTVYTSIVDVFAVRATGSPVQPRLSFYIVVGVLVVGVVVSSLRSIIKQRRFRNYINANGDYATDEERTLLSAIAGEILRKADRVALKKTDAVTGAMVIGFVKKTILIPDREYSDDELKMILRHECTHIRNKDLWIKLLIQIYCCIFWWNPFAYLLKHDLDFSLELKCDLGVTKDVADSEKAVYVDVLRKSAVMKKQGKKPFVVCAELTDGKKNEKLLKRVLAVIAEPQKKSAHLIANTCVAVVFLAIFIVSYVFIWQPFYGYDIPEEEYSLSENDVVSDDSNSYLVRQEDGSYLFYFLDFSPQKVSKEEVEQGLFEGYPIYEE